MTERGPAGDYPVVGVGAVRRWWHRAAPWTNQQIDDHGGGEPAVLAGLPWRGGFNQTIPLRWACAARHPIDLAQRCLIQAWVKQAPATLLQFPAGA